MNSFTRLICVAVALMCLCGNVDGKEQKHFYKHKYKILLDEVDYGLDSRIVLVLDQTNKHYCVYLVDLVKTDDFDKMGIKEVFSYGEPVNFEMAKELVDIEKLGLNLYGF